MCVGGGVCGGGEMLYGKLCLRGQVFPNNTVIAHIFKKKLVPKNSMLNSMFPF